VIQADGTYQADPDLATVISDISAQDAQDKHLKATYEQASSSMPKIINLAERNGLKKEDISSGVLTVRPFYEGDRKKRAKSYLVRGEITLRIHDFLKLGPILEGSVDDGITDFRSLTYSLADEETAKQKTAAEAMKQQGVAQTPRSSPRAREWMPYGSRIRMTGVAAMNVYSMQEYNAMLRQTGDVSSGVGKSEARRAAAPPPLVPQPERISVTATLPCAFQIQ
jgi:hypothetical protein